VHLTVGQQWIDDRAAIVDCSVIDQCHLSGVAVDIDYRDMGTERERGVGAFPVDLDEQTGTQPVVGRVGQRVCRGL